MTAITLSVCKGSANRTQNKIKTALFCFAKNRHVFAKVLATIMKSQEMCFFKLLG